MSGSEESDSGRFFGKFELLGKLGRGGVATVYRVRESTTGRELALKAMALGQDAGARTAGRFEREARILAGVSHPNLLPIYELARHGRFYYYTMPVVQGQTLQDLLEQRGRLDGREAAALLAPVADALDAIHQAGYVHRDLKPGNILVDPSGKPILIDFGIAKALDRHTQLTHSGERFGTPAYMAPEQVRASRDVDHRADIWSLGVIFYELLCGERPFTGESMPALLCRITEGEPPSLRGADREAAAIALTCLARDPARRYPDARALAADLSAYRDQQPITARPPRAMERLELLLRRQLLLMATTGALALVLATVTIRSLVEARNLRARSKAKTREAARDLAVAIGQRDWRRMRPLAAFLADRPGALSAIDPDLFAALLAGQVPPSLLPDATADALARPRALAAIEASGAFDVGWPTELTIELSRKPGVAAERIQLAGLPAGLPLSLAPGRAVQLPAGAGALQLRFSGEGLVPWEAQWKPPASGKLRIVPLRIPLAELPGNWRILAEPQRRGDTVRFVVQTCIGPIGARSLDQARAFSSHALERDRRRRRDTQQLTHQTRERREGTTPRLERWRRQYVTATSRRDRTVQSRAETFNAACRAACGELLAGKFAAGRKILSELISELNTWQTPAAGSRKKLREQLALLHAFPDSLARAVGRRWKGEVLVLELRDGEPRSGTLVAADWLGLSLRQGGFTVRTGWPEVDLPVLAEALGNAIRFPRRPVLVVDAGKVEVAGSWFGLTHAHADRLSLHTGGCLSVAFDRAGARLASGSVDKTIRLWEVKGRRPLDRLPLHASPVRSVAFSPDGTLLASASNDIRIWDAKSGHRLATLTGRGNYLWSVAFSPDGTLLASASDDNTIDLWDVKTRVVLGTMQGHKGSVRSVAFSPDGALLASAADDGTIRIWSMKTRRTLAILPGHKGSVHSVAFSPDGALLASAAGDGTIRIWDWKSRSFRPLATLKGHTGSVHSVAFSPDGALLASAGRDATIRIWDARTRQALAILKGHQMSVNCVTFSPDGTLLASASDDKTIRLWGVR